MAKENIAKFFDAVIADKALAEKFAALASENGFEFTMEELLEFGAARSISDSELSDVSGGTSLIGGRRTTL